MGVNFNEILSSLPEIMKGIEALREIVLSNLVMISEIPAPTFHEQKRVDFLVNRFDSDYKLNCSTDEVGNFIGILPGMSGDRDILLVAHMDTIFDDNVDHSVTINTDFVRGASVGDNSLSVAVLASLPYILQNLDIRLESNLVLMGSARSLGRGDIEGISFFLKNSEMTINSGIVIESLTLGRLSYSSIGMLRCEIISRVPETYDWTRFGVIGAITPINEVINKILEIPLPKRPQTGIVLGSLEGGSSFNTIATEASLKFEIRSESESMVESLKERIENIASEVSSHTGAEVTLYVYSQRNPGGIQFSHPLSKRARQILDSLQIKPRISPSTSELCAFIDNQIPALTIGLTTGENLGKKSETIEIKPFFKGITQLLGIILAVDQGFCNE